MSYPTHEDVKLFACVCLEQKLFDQPTCVLLGESAGEDCELLPFAEMIINLGICTDEERVQTALDAACDRFHAGERASYNPFVAVAARPSIAMQPRAAAPEPAVQAAAATRAPVAAAPQPTAQVYQSKLPPGLPQFSELAKLDDEALSQRMQSLLRWATAQGISDLHICAGARPFARQNRALRYLGNDIIPEELSRRMNTILLSESERAHFEKANDYDYSLAFASGERYRVNLMVHKDGPAGTYRTIAAEVPSLHELGFNPQQIEVIQKLLSYHNGLLLVTGPVGAGKTTTLATLIKELNATREDHIITVEQPIEIVQKSQGCSITQRAVGPHTKSFHSALKGALRQDPDIIVIGEMRDLETIEMAISASETGHLVIGTMHTADSASTLNRILDVFPPAQQTQIRAMVAESLRGIICQRLLPCKTGGLVLAVEILLKNTAVSSLIREGKSEGLANIMETGKKLGMIRMDASVLDLWRAGKITDEVALANIQNKMLHPEITGVPAGGHQPVAAEPAKKKGFW